MADELSKEMQEKLAQLQMLQQRIQLFSAQKQQFQLHQMELENALEELKNAKKATYKLVGEVLIEKDKSELKKELDDELKQTKVRLDAIEKQEKLTHEKAMSLQKEVTASLKD